MLVAFVGYIATMVVALAAVVAAWFVVIGPPTPVTHQPPRPAIGQIGRTTALETAPPQQPKTQSAQQAQPAQSGTWGPAVVHRADEGAATTAADEAGAAAEHAAAAEKAKQLKTARYRKRKEQEARQRQEQQAQQGQEDDQRGQYGRTYSKQDNDQYEQSGRTYSRPYSTALGYDREGPRDRPPPRPLPFFFFGPPRY